MSQDQGLAQFKVTDATLMVIVQIRAADSSGPKSNYYFTGTWSRFGEFFNLQVFSSMDDTGDHK